MVLRPYFIIETWLVLDSSRKLELVNDSAIIGTNNTEVNHSYGLHSGGVKAYRHVPNTKHFSEFVPSKYL